MEIIIIWILSVADLSTKVQKYNGSLSKCQTEAKDISDNINTTQAVAGCLRIVVNPPWLRRS
jgi:hypothetical protein|tara:strand:+ start:100 stop:285 length:186 start_codon:yes stop_codon:yes gene_type:complete